jgi:predicted small lipoprotein YifL
MTTAPLTRRGALVAMMLGLLAGCGRRGAPRLPEREPEPAGTGS